jgi:hypothetical protein
MLYANVLKHFADVEATLGDITRNDILQLGAHEGVAFAGLNMKERNYYLKLAIDTDDGAILDVL